MSLYECPRCGTEVVHELREYTDTDTLRNEKVVITEDFWHCPNCDYIVPTDRRTKLPDFPQSSENWSHE